MLKQDNLIFGLIVVLSLLFIFFFGNKDIQKDKIDKKEPSVSSEQNFQEADSEKINMLKELAKDEGKLFVDLVD